mmetsp:Transcript_37517/g.120397  ORF Transcript_37517/g.120397 Transcript_37517/m.120397 type:complete len:298 (-) Transcript_37517:1978-2871(-)
MEGRVRRPRRALRVRSAGGAILGHDLLRGSGEARGGRRRLLEGRPRRRSPAVPRRERRRAAVEARDRVDARRPAPGNTPNGRPRTSVALRLRARRHPHHRRRRLGRQGRVLARRRRRRRGGQRVNNRGTTARSKGELGANAGRNAPDDQGRPRMAPLRDTGLVVVGVRDQLVREQFASEEGRGDVSGPRKAVRPRPPGLRGGPRGTRPRRRPARAAGARRGGSLRLVRRIGRARNGRRRRMGRRRVRGVVRKSSLEYPRGRRLRRGRGQGLLRLEAGGLSEGPASPGDREDRLPRTG